MTSDKDQNDGIFLPHRRPVAVRLLSSGVKYRTKEGYLRDQREHDTDTFGIEYEVELLDYENEVARLFISGKNPLEGFKSGDLVAIGWRIENNTATDGKRLTTIGNVAWRLEDCYTPLS